MDEGNYISGSQAFHFSEEELNTQKSLASNGNADAAFILYKYYAYGRNDLNTAYLWLKKSADLGSQPAMTSMANKYINEGNIKEAKKYMEKLNENSLRYVKPLPKDK